MTIYRRLLARPGLSRYDTALARNNLANSLRREYDASHDAALLDEAVELQEAALEALGERGAETEKQRANLANDRSARFQAGGDVRDAEAAIALYGQVLAVASTAARTRDEAAANLGSVLFLLGQHSDDERMAREGVEWWERALTGRSAAADPAFVIDLSRQASAIVFMPCRAVRGASAFGRGLRRARGRWLSFARWPRPLRRCIGSPRRSMTGWSPAACSTASPSSWSTGYWST